MATVASEAPRYRMTACSRVFIAADIAGRPFGIQYASAKQAARSLTAIARDLYTVLQTYYVPPPLTPAGNPYAYPAMVIPGYADALDLIDYLQYICKGPFLAMVQQRNLNMIGLPTPDDQLFRLHCRVILIYSYLAEAYIRRTTVLALRAAPNYLLFLNNCSVTANPTVHNVPALGSVEMLCRTVAAGCANLATFQNRLLGVGGGNPGLTLRLLPPLPAPVHGGGLHHLCKRKGIPGTIFICMGQFNAIAVVTTSQDNWAGFARVELWAHSLRQTLHRLRWRNGLQPALRDTDNIPAQSFNIRTAYTQQTALIPLVHANILAARDNVIANPPGNPPAIAPGFLNHTLEVATALRCPRLTPKARCLRCQALFRYNVPPPVAVLETNLRNNLGAACRSRRYCAETIAHYLCTDAGAGH